MARIGKTKERIPKIRYALLVILGDASICVSRKKGLEKLGKKNLGALYYTIEGPLLAQERALYTLQGATERRER